MYTYLSIHVQIQPKFSERVKKKSFNKKYAVKFNGIIARNDFTSISSISNFLLLIKTENKTTNQNMPQISETE